MDLDSTAWMPPGMDPEEKALWADMYPGDPHMAAARAWESWAAQLDPTDPATAGQGVRTVSTGAQSVTYDGASSTFGACMERSDWHRARARVYSVQVGPEYGVRDPEESYVEVYASPPIPPTGPAQINLPTGTVGPPPLGRS